MRELIETAEPGPDGAPVRALTLAPELVIRESAPAARADDAP
ncbi:MAG: hypothetical protein WKF78_01210 [Candidatus Limnocylindrales bacterium]